MLKCNYYKGGGCMLLKRWLLNDRQMQDLNPLIAGEEACPPGKSFGPHIRSYTLLHYVRSGRGTLFSRGKAHPVHAGQLFIILPGEVTTYTADSIDPWHYCWVGFNGALADRFRQLPAVVDADEGLILSLFPKDGQKNPEMHIAGGLFQLCAALLPAAAESGSHVQKVKNLIAQAYMQPLQVADIANALHLDRRYLTRIFRESTGLSIQQYLMDVRMAAADRHLSQGCSVQDTARLCGYADSSNFSRMYKKHRGISPQAYRKL
jgi:AraC-like DNA-binding protein